MTHPVEQQIRDRWPPEEWQDVVVIVAVSGGADSVAMLHALSQLSPVPPLNLVIAHFNHQLRERSSADEQFVAQLGDRLQLRCEIGCPDRDLREESSGSLEETARDARYEFLKQVARRYGARYVATAHTADDQIETILQRILRGTGIPGLAGIPPTRELIPGTTLVRPLLTCRRADILNYLQEREQSYVDDETNHDLRFSRNRIRNELLPHLERDYNARVDDALLRLGSLAEETTGYLETVADNLIARHVSIDEHSAEIDCTELRDLPAFMRRVLLMRIWRRMAWPQQDMSYDKWEQLAEQMRTSHGTDRVLVLPGSVRCERRGDKQVLARP